MVCQAEGRGSIQGYWQCTGIVAGDGLVEIRWGRSGYRLMLVVNVKDFANGRVTREKAVRLNKAPQKELIESQTDKKGSFSKACPQWRHTVFSG